MALPLLLLGPILRRVEPRAVSVFLAASEAANVRVAIYDGPVDSAAPPPELAAAEVHTRRFGAAFHATVVTVDFADASALQPGHLYSYDVRITPSGGAAQSLADLRLLGDSVLEGYGNADPARQPVEVGAIGYAENRLPSFVTCPADLDELVIAHGSCRKPHGFGSPALQYLDDYVDDLDGATAGRPHMLFLTGDQIYADDVAAALLPGLSARGKELLGGAEEIPPPRGNDPLAVHSDLLPAGFRQKLTALAGFTSEEAASHLIGFGEWLAMYCAAWNPVLWPVLARPHVPDSGVSNELRAKLQADRDASPADAPEVLGEPAHSPNDPITDLITPLYSGTKEANDALAEVREDFHDARAILDEFRREVPKVRRLLANVPTYMICDDHEVTDDWFMTAAIRAQTTANPFGKALLRNALAAFTICQAWGDDPTGWASEPNRQALLDGIAGMFPEGWNGGLPQSAGTDAVDQALSLAPNAQPMLDFSFTVDGPKHRVRVLDTRTRREYDSPAGSPGLLSQEALDHQLPHEDLPDGHVLVLVSPAPVFGPPIMNEIGGAIAASAYDLVSMARAESERSGQQDVTGLPAGGRPIGMQYFDAEHWGAHPTAYERLLERLSHYPRVVVLAGDVHYGAAFAMDWTAPPATGHPRTSRIVHFTSSAARNAWQGVVRNLMILNGMATGLQRIGFPMTRLGWSVTLPQVVEGLAAEPPLTRIRVQTAPVLLSNEMFRTVHQLEREPEWLWRAQPIADERASVDRPPAARVPEPPSDLPSDSSAVHHYGEAAALHVEALGTVAIARGLQFLNNAGLIAFATNGDGIHVSQALYSIRPRPEPNEKGDAYVVHTVRLEPDPVPVPTEIGPGA
jgi:hypothetical protein